VGAAECHRVYYREYGGGILPRSGPWCVSWPKVPVACPNSTLYPFLELKAGSVPPSLNFPQLDFVKPSSGFHPVTWERVKFSKGLAVFKVMADMYQQIIVVSDNDSNYCGANGISLAFY
jgi:hypothetical protein